jgi:hypothetical protein
MIMCIQDQITSDERTRKFSVLLHKAAAAAIHQKNMVTKP